MAFSWQEREVLYVTPQYLLNAAQKKYGRRIEVIGAEENALLKFWSSIEAKAAYHDQERPNEDSRLIIDITAKEHCNTGETDDVIEVETSQEETKRVTNSYTLAFKKESGWEFGGGLKVGGSFFNTAGAFLGIEGKRNKSIWQSQEQKNEEERALSQSYGIKATKITVPPRTKVAVTITTYAVTYKVKVKVIVSVPATSYIPFYYKKYICNLLCSCLRRRCKSQRYFGFITAQELFKNQNEFQDLGYCIQFTAESVLSYIGETVELHKELKKLQPSIR